MRKYWANGLQIGHLAVSYFCFLFNSRISKYYKPLDPRGLAFVLWSLEFFFSPPALFLGTVGVWCLIAGRVTPTARSRGWPNELMTQCRALRITTRCSDPVTDPTPNTARSRYSGVFRTSTLGRTSNGSYCCDFPLCCQGC